MEDDRRDGDEPSSPPRVLLSPLHLDAPARPYAPPVTLCELHGKIVNIAGPDDDPIAQYQKQGGVRYPHVIVPGKEPVKALAWHKYKQVLAVVADDIVHIFDLIHQKWYGISLAHPLQQNVIDVEWRPNAGHSLAVLAKDGVCLWRLATDSLEEATEPSIGWLQYLPYPNHTPLTTMAWSPDGLYLATGSGRDNTLVVWDVAQRVPTPMYLGGSSLTLLRWSPDSRYLFAATSSNECTIWQTANWTWQTWSLTRSCQTATWNSNGTLLLLSSKNEHKIHVLRFAKNSTGGAFVSTEVVDVNQSGEASETRIPLSIGSVAWSPTGERLALSTTSKQTPGPAIALYSTDVSSSSVDLHSIGMMHGPPGTFPLHFRFSPTFTHGALLAVCWSNGKIGFYPCLFG